jgi:hypothetical protein
VTLNGVEQGHVQATVFICGRAWRRWPPGSSCG